MTKAAAIPAGLLVIVLVVTCVLGRNTAVTQPAERGLRVLVFEGHELHPSLRTRPMDDSVRHMPPQLIPSTNPYLSNEPAFIETIARGGSQSRLSGEGIRSVLYALYVDEKELGFYGLEAESTQEADVREKALRGIWAKNISVDRASVHRKGTLILVIWTDGVSPECWEAVNARVAERLGP